MDVQIENLKDIFDYNPDTGSLHWKVRVSQKIKPGMRAGWRDCNGYLKVTIGGRRHRVHRIVWAIFYGEWPKSMIDHINGDGEDNRICNLRLVANHENLQNIRKPYSGSAVDRLGVSLDGKKYRAQISNRGLRINLGSFATKDEAYAAYVAAKRELHKTCTI